MASSVLRIPQIIFHPPTACKHMQHGSIEHELHCNLGVADLDMPISPGQGSFLMYHGCQQVRE